MRPNIWNDDLGTYWAANDTRYDAMLAPLTEQLLPAARLRSSDDVLDVGCGCGNTTRVAAGTASSVLGVDLSEAMLATARRRATEAGIDNIRFEFANAQVTPFDPVDVVLSQLGVMFFDDPIAAFTNLHRALRPGGRLVFVCWQAHELNENRVVKRTALAEHLDLPPLDPAKGAMSLAEPRRVREVLGAAGFTDVELTDVREPVLIGRTAQDAADFQLGDPIVAGWLTDASQDTTARVAEALRSAYAERESPSGVWLGSAAWLVTARA